MDRPDRDQQVVQGPSRLVSLFNASTLFNGCLTWYCHSERSEESQIIRLCGLTANSLRCFASLNMTAKPAVFCLRNCYCAATSRATGSSTRQTFSARIF